MPLNIVRERIRLRHGNGGGTKRRRRRIDGGRPCTHCCRLCCPHRSRRSSATWRFLPPTTQFLPRHSTPYRQTFTHQVMIAAKDNTFFNLLRRFRFSQPALVAFKSLNFRCTTAPTTPCGTRGANSRPSNSSDHARHLVPQTPLPPTRWTPAAGNRKFEDFLVFSSAAVPRHPRKVRRRPRQYVA